MDLARLLLIALLLLTSPRPILAGNPGGIGVLGDSYSDEYQFYPPDRSTARNWVEILAATRGLDFGPFSLESRGEPRNQGFAFNWARSDASSDDLIATGQHTGLAEQVARGEVGLVVISIGGNDFIHAFQSPDPMTALRDVFPRNLENYRLAVETILDARDDVKVVLATLPDIRNLPEISAPVRSGLIPSTTADAYSAAIARFNARIKALAARHPRIALLDLDLAMRGANLLSHDQIIVDGLRIDRVHPSDHYEAFFLADGRHIGTVGQGVLARMLIATINQRFDAGIAPLGEREIVEFARRIPSPVPPGSANQVAGLKGETRDPSSSPVAMP